MLVSTTNGRAEPSAGAARLSRVRDALERYQAGLHGDFTFMREARAKYLGDQALHLVKPGPFPNFDKKGKAQVPTDKLKDALQQCLRSVELRRLAPPWGTASQLRS